MCRMIRPSTEVRYYGSGRRDSNPHYPAWEAGVLPLHHDREGSIIPPIECRTEHKEGQALWRPAPQDGTRLGVIREPPEHGFERGGRDRQASLVNIESRVVVAFVQPTLGV